LISTGRALARVISNVNAHPELGGRSAGAGRPQELGLSVTTALPRVSAAVSPERPEDRVVRWQRVRRQRERRRSQPPCRPGQRLAVRPRSRWAQRRDGVKKLGYLSANRVSLARRPLPVPSHQTSRPYHTAIRAKSCMSHAGCVCQKFPPRTPLTMPPPRRKNRIERGRSAARISRDGKSAHPRR